MKERLEEFAGIYDRRPIVDNVGGMKAPHMFAAWFVLQTLQPRIVIESGVWRGQGTWLIEQACPQARIYCLDINISKVEYKSRQATYLERDFATVDWTGVPKEETVVLFDDHQNAYERCRLAHWMGFRHLLFDDNYPPGRGDVYSLKKAFGGAGNRPSLLLTQRALAIVRGRWVPIVRSTAPNQTDGRYLRDNVEIYQELPPVFRIDKTRWGDAWNDISKATPEPLISELSKSYERLFAADATSYTWMCYVKLRR